MADISSKAEKRLQLQINNLNKRIILLERLNRIKDAEKDSFIDTVVSKKRDFDFVLSVLLDYFKITKQDIDIQKQSKACKNLGLSHKRTILVYVCIKDYDIKPTLLDKFFQETFTWLRRNRTSFYPLIDRMEFSIANKEDNPKLVADYYAIMKLLTSIKG